MINFNADIISYKSIGNIEIGRNVEFYIDELYKNFDVKETQYVVSKSVEKDEIRYEYSLTNKQWIKFGALVIDQDYGMIITLPSPYDEIADYLKDIPLNLILNEIYVGNFDSW